MSTENSIKCPNCGTQIDIDEIFYHQIEKKFKTQHLQEQKIGMKYWCCLRLYFVKKTYEKLPNLTPRLTQLLSSLTWVRQRVSLKSWVKR